MSIPLYNQNKQAHIASKNQGRSKKIVAQGANHNSEQEEP